MRLANELPSGVYVGRRFYRCDFDFRNVLRLMETLGRDDLLPEARDYLALKCIMRKPKRVRETLTEVKRILFRAKPQESGPKITDFDQDADYIRAAFWQTYGIDLWNVKLHWLQFSALLGGLPEGSRYMDILGIRARPMPEPTQYNAKERIALAKAKATYALKMTEEEEQEQLQKSLVLVAESLKAMVKAGEKRNAGL